MLIPIRRPALLNWKWYRVEKLENRLNAGDVNDVDVVAVSEEGGDGITMSWSGFSVGRGDDVVV